MNGLRQAQPERLTEQYWGVTRGSHAKFQRLDEARMVEMARRINGAMSRNPDQ